MDRKLSLLSLPVVVLILAFLLQERPLRQNRSQPVLEIKPANRPLFSPTVRVNLTSSPVKSIKLAVDASYRVHRVGGSETITSGTLLKSATVSLTKNGFQLGRRRWSGSQIEINSAKSPSIWIDGHQYRGTVRLFRKSDDRFIAVNVLPLEEYLASVVDSEMPAAFPQAARRAQAVVARTYALYQMQEARRHPHFDLYASSRSQRYLGVQYRDAKGRRLAGETKSGRNVVRETSGVACITSGKIFCTYYSAVCGGRTTAGKSVFADAAAPLQSVECNWCREADRYRWKRTVSRSAAGSALKEYFKSRGKPFGRLTRFAGPSQVVSTPATLFRVADGTRDYRVSAVVLRRNLFPSTLPSTRFSVRENGGNIEFHGRGHGHGVGLCQWGARGLALTGKDFAEILQFYYPGSRLVRLRPE